MTRATRGDGDADEGGGSGGEDPVLDRRARIAGWVETGQRVGYGLYGLAIVVFVSGFVTTFADWMVTVTVAALVVGSIVLAPAIVFGYGVKAAEREDRGGWR